MTQVLESLQGTKASADRGGSAPRDTKPPMHRKGSIKGRVFAPTTLQERLIARRQELNLSQIQVAEKITFWNNKQKSWKQLSRSAYCMYESGEVVPDLDKIIRLSQVLHCTPEWIAFGLTNTSDADRIEEVDYDSKVEEFVCKRFWDLDPAWVRSRFDAEPQDVVLTLVNDFSSSLKPGDLAFVRKGAEPGVGGGEFVYAQGDEITVAHVTRPQVGGPYRVYDSDLRHHTEVPAGDLIFLGKVVGKMGDL